MTALRCTNAPCATTMAVVSAGQLVLWGHHHRQNHRIALPLAHLLETVIDEATLPLVAAALLSRIAQPHAPVLESAQTI